MHLPSRPRVTSSSCCTCFRSLSAHSYQIEANFTWRDAKENNCLAPTIAFNYLPKIENDRPTTGTQIEQFIMRRGGGYFIFRFTLKTIESTSMQVNLPGGFSKIELLFNQNSEFNRNNPPFRYYRFSSFVILEVVLEMYLQMQPRGVKEANI